MDGKKRYEYDKDLRMFAFFNPPVVRPLLPFIQFAMKAFYFTQIPDKKIKTETIKIPVGKDVKIRAVVYTPEGFCKRNNPCVIFYHGGGFVYNAAPHHFTLAKNLAKNLGVKVFFIDYRLAPDYPFPTAADDALASYKYISENAECFGIDEKRIALCGDSAGGNLAAVTALRARDEKLTPPCAQVLIYPFVDGDRESPSMKMFTDTPMCNSKAAVKYNEAYIPEGYTDFPEWFSVVDAENHKNMPATYIETAEYDCLHDGGVKYAGRLRDAGNRVVLFETNGTMHGYDIATKSEIYRLCMKKRCDFLKDAFNK